MRCFPDAELARLAATGRVECFEELLARYRNRVYRICYRCAGNPEDAEDWSQECFIRAYRHLGYYDPRLPFEPWLLRIVYNTCVNLAKARSRRRVETLVSIADVEESAVPARTPDPLARALCADEERQALQAVEGLPPELRAAVVLRVLEDLSFRELSEVLGVPLQTAATRVRRALELIRKRIGVERTEASRRLSGRGEVDR